MKTDRGDAEPLPYGITPEGPRLPAATRLGPVRLQVSDVDRSLGWYREALGFRVVDRAEAFVRLAAEGEGEVLVELHEREGAASVPRRERLGLYHFAILLPDRAALGRFASHLKEKSIRAGASDHRVSEAFYLNDPDGLGIEVYADRPRDSWQRDGRQLVMATDPLDVEEVILAGAGVPWTGMPDGTVIGHVHLHVGDLARAEDFYHQALGLDKVVWSYPGALFLSAGGYHHHLGVNTWAAGAVPAAEDEARLLEWELILPSGGEVEAVLGNLEAAGHAVERDAAGGSAPDPWGTVLRIRNA